MINLRSAILLCTSAMTLNALSLTLQGESGVKGVYYPKEKTDRPTADVQLFVQLDGSLHLNESMDLRFRGEGNLQYEDTLHPHLNTEDLYFDYFSPHFEFRAGIQSYSWEKVETISRVNVINSYDFQRDFVDPAPVGQPAGRVRFIGGDHIVEAIYLPYFLEPGLPETSSRFFLFQDLPLPVTIEEYPDFDSEYREFRPQGAIRYSTRIGDLDLALHYFNGYRRLPLYNSTLSRSGITIGRTYPLIHHAGFACDYITGDLIIKAEGVYQQLQESHYNRAGNEIRPYFSYTTGVEYPLYSIISQHDLTLYCELIGDTDAGKDHSEIEDAHPYRSNIFLGGRYSVNNLSSREFSAGALCDYLENEWLLTLGYEEVLFNRVSIELATQHFVNATTPEVKRFSENSRLVARVSYNF